MYTRDAIITLGALLLLTACSGPSGTNPSMPAAGGSAARAGSGGAGGTVIDAAPAAMAADGTVSRQIETLLGDAAQYKRVFNALQKAVATNDKAAVAALADFPLTISVGGQRVIENAGQFVKEYDRIITPSVATTITRQKFADVLVSSQGVMFGDGEVWLSGSCRNTSCSQQVVKISRIQEVEGKGAAKFPLTVKVTLSDAAASRMWKESETVVIRVAYFGAAAPGAKNVINDVGMVDLGWASKELAVDDHKARFDGSRFQRDRLKFISGAPQVNINVYSGRHASSDNILDCGSYEANLSTATQVPVQLDCKLLQGG